MFFDACKARPWLSHTSKCCMNNSGGTQNNFASCCSFVLPNRCVMLVASCRLVFMAASETCTEARYVSNTTYSSKSQPFAAKHFASAGISLVFKLGPHSVVLHLLCWAHQTLCINILHAAFSPLLVYSHYPRHFAVSAVEMAIQQSVVESTVL